MVEIGAGGGSIARVDALQRILVGPDSAGAEPGPACYGRGGTEPTVTDADLAIGKIDPARFAGGKIAIDPAKAEAALAAGDRRQALACRRSRPPSASPRSSTRTWPTPRACTRSSAASPSPSARWWPSAARRPCTRAGSPRSSALARIIVPPDAGVGSAIGFLAAPAAYEIVRSRYMRLDTFDAEAANALSPPCSARPRRTPAPRQASGRCR